MKGLVLGGKARDTGLSEQILRTWAKTGQSKLYELDWKSSAFSKGGEHLRIHALIDLLMMSIIICVTSSVFFLHIKRKYIYLFEC